MRGAVLDNVGNGVAAPESASNPNIVKGGTHGERAGEMAHCCFEGLTY
jgi:hypothetical protein